MDSLTFALICLLIQTICNAQITRLSLCWESINCEGNPEFVQNFTCIIHKPKNDQISVEMYYVKEIVRPFMRFSLYNKKHRKMVDMEFDCCKYMLEGPNQVFAHAVFSSMRRNSNVPKKCPISGYIYYRNISALENLPPYFPKNYFYINLYVYVPPNTYISNTTLEGRLD